jgi:Mn-dependent DtxR family transcriptional regulator
MSNQMSQAIMRRLAAVHAAQTEEALVHALGATPSAVQHALAGLLADGYVHHPDGGYELTLAGRHLVDGD